MYQLYFQYRIWSLKPSEGFGKTHMQLERKLQEKKYHTYKSVSWLTSPYYYDPSTPAEHLTFHWLLHPELVIWREMIKYRS